MRAFVVSALASWIVPLSAFAAEAVIADDSAHACFEASQSARADREAVHTCDLALESNDLNEVDRGGALVNRGVIHMRRGELAAAQSDFDAGIPLIPNVAEAWFNRGAVFIGERRFSDALADFDKAIALGVHEPAKAYYFRGIAHDDLGDETAAYHDYQQAVALAPDWAPPKRELERFSVTRR